jgi:hypothetical protein
MGTSKMNEAAARHRNRTRNEPNNIVWEFITLLAGKRLRDTACREAFARITRDLPCAARLRATMASEMLHKFKIGQTVNYHPKDRILSTARGTYIQGLCRHWRASNANIGSDTSAVVRE